MKTYKLMIIDSISIEIDDSSHAKDVSRVKMRLLQNGEPSLTHTTKSYAQIHQNELRWSESFEFRYRGQTKLAFQTYCEHEYGYNLQELEVLYRGVYFVKNEMFFKRDSCHIYSKEGEKKGLLRWQLKVVTREEEEIIEQKKEVIKPLVREDLIGLIKLYEATFEVANPIFNKKKHKNLELKIQFGSDTWIINDGNDLCWKLNEIKLEYVHQGSKSIDFQLIHEGKDILQGSTACENIEKLKRYIKHKVSLFNKNGIKLGSLVIQYRFVEKQQLLDLLYSPNCKINAAQRSKSSENLGEQQTQRTFLNKSANKLPNKQHVSFFNESQVNSANRYKIGYLMNHNSDILIPKASRFPQRKPNSPFVSYIDPEKSSDFSPMPNKGWHISRGSKFDFTRQYRDNPGVGSYKLPSIWSKY